MRWSRPFGLSWLPLFLGLLFCAASMTPSLIPRDGLVQGVLGGLVAALGYLIGRAAQVLWGALGLPMPAGRSAAIGRLLIGAPVMAVFLRCLWSAERWQNTIRARMDMPPVEHSHIAQMLAVAAVVFAVLTLTGRGLRLAWDRTRNSLSRYMPQRTADLAGLLLVGTALFVVTRDGVLDRVIAGLDKSYTTAQALFDTAPPAPDDPERPGGTGSLLNWGAMGQPGRDYVTGGPDAAAITALTGRPAREPIRVYVGLAEDDDPEARARVALAELIRLDAFDRKVLVVAMPTGTGWLDPGSVDVLEYLHGGDVATVAAQYSYLQSPLALILETDAGLAQARALIRTVHDHWKTLPQDRRPRLYMHGLSLGAWASMHGTDLFALLDDPINGALWAGPPFPSARWIEATAARNPSSPYYAPVVGDGRLIRFATHRQDAGGPDGWGTMRLAFLQYPSDPIVFYEPTSLWRAPAWMREPPADDVSPALRFIPVVTQFQLAVDMLLATSAPPGHGHAYIARDYIGPWRAVTAPEAWTDEDTARLVARCSLGFQQGCENRPRR